MVAHDYSKPIGDCPACQRLLQITHDFSKSPSDCPGCVEKAAIQGGYAGHATNGGGGADHASANHASVTPTTCAGNAPHNLISAHARDAAREAVQRMRTEQAAKHAVAASWDSVITEMNNRNRSPGGG